MQPDVVVQDLRLGNIPDSCPKYLVLEYQS
jgi:hypothetical protein